MAIKDFYKEKDDEMVSMSKEDFIDEHIHLIKVLKSGDKKALEAEAKKQEEELASEMGDEEED